MRYAENKADDDEDIFITVTMDYITLNMLYEYYNTLCARTKQLFGSASHRDRASDCTGSATAPGTAPALHFPTLAA